MNSIEQHERQPSPSQYMRERRPHLFSDTRAITKIALTREVLSYHLETLTKQKLETVFEGFAQRLAERFIAPNMRPQTGPTGGGDGKTDSETYPVADAISERWFAVYQAAGSERWAFAFSAKEDWQGKVKSDVKSIIGTGRNYDRIYFITNQFAPSVKSSKIQDYFKKDHDLQITILDRTWILDSVFDRGALDIVQTCLDVGALEHDTAIGPRDLQRRTELDSLEKLIADSTAYQGRAPVLADDALRAALLARGLELPRYEIDGRFDRAVRLARQNASQSQHLAAIYDWAWTSFFWFEDADKLSELYEDVEKLAIKSRDANELERLNNLLPLLINAVHQGMLNPDVAKIESRRSALFAALEAVKIDTARPNNALHAHALLLLSRITTVAADGSGEELNNVWEEFTGIVTQSRGLGTFPFDSIAQALTGLGDVVPDSIAFDILYEAVTDALAERQKEGTAAKLNSERGYQKLRKGLRYDAIRWFGRAVGLLIKQEYEEELFEALQGSSIAYMEAGLFWAARNYALAAATGECRKFRQSGRMDDIDPSILSQWFECELHLGRVPFALSAYELGAMVRNARSRTSEQQEFAEGHRIEQSHRLAALLVGTRFDDLSRLEGMPAVLDRLGLLQASTTLMFLMGGEKALRESGSVPDEETADGIEELFNQLTNASVEAGLSKPDYLLDQTVHLRSQVLGCEISIHCENTLASIGVGEAVLGTIESLLATSLRLRTLPNLDRLRIHISSDRDAGIQPTLKFTEEAGSTVPVISHRPKLIHSSRDEIEGFLQWLSDAAVRIFLTFAVPEAPEKWGETVVAGESGFVRAVTFSNIPDMYRTIYGEADKLAVEDWSRPDDPKIDVTRDSAWQPKEGEKRTDRKGLRAPAMGEPPEGFFDPENRKHSDYRIVTPIDARKWDAAVWRAVFFMCSPGNEFTPRLGITFEKREPAAEIFEAWHERYGETDPGNDLRIAIITGVNISNPHAYGVIIGPNFEALPTSPSQIVGFVARRNIMQPQNSRNLDLFLSEYRRLGRFKLVAAHLTGMASPPDPIGDYGLEKHHLVVRPAWTIAENDPDSCVLDLDDPPIIPNDQTDAPVLKAMEWKARMLRSRE